MHFYFLLLFATLAPPTVDAVPRWRVLTPPGCPAPCGETAPHARDVQCVDDGADNSTITDANKTQHWVRPVADALCEPSTRPPTFANCTSKCLHVSPTTGSDAADVAGTDPGAPLRTLGECLRRFKDEQASSNLPDAGWATARHTRRCLLFGGRYTEHVKLDAIREVSIEPFAPGADDVLFDATDDISPGTSAWSAATCPSAPGASDDAIVCARVVAPRLSALVVDGEALACDSKSENEDLCLAWDPRRSWARRFSRSAIGRCLGGAPADDTPCDVAAAHPNASDATSGTWWWWSDGILRVNTKARNATLGASYEWPPSVRVKVTERRRAIELTGGSYGVIVKGIRFRAASVWLWSHNSRVPRLGIENCRFLYVQAGDRAATLHSYDGMGRGFGGRVYLRNNTFEFGEGGPR